MAKTGNFNGNGARGRHISNMGNRPFADALPFLYHGRARAMVKPQGKNGEVKVLQPADPEKIKAYRASMEAQTARWRRPNNQIFRKDLK